MKFLSEKDLGGKEITKEKMVFLSLILFSFLYLIYRYTFVQNPVYLFYSSLLAFSLIFIGFDMITKDNYSLDTVLIEKNSPINIKTQIFLGIGLSLMLAFWIGLTGQALVKANPFGIVFQAQPSLDAFDSAIMGGIVETLFFFAVLYPTLHAILTDYFDKFGGILAMFLASLIFMFMHDAVYGYNEPVLLTVFVFAFFFNVLPIFFTRSIILPVFAHATNNFIVVLFKVTQMSILFLI